MRCIEILVRPMRRRFEVPPINRNMRCIEIILLGIYQAAHSTINRNMRCIEIEDIGCYGISSDGLIET